MAQTCEYTGSPGANELKQAAVSTVIRVARVTLAVVCLAVVGAVSQVPAHTSSASADGFQPVGIIAAGRMHEATVILYAAAGRAVRYRTVRLQRGLSLAGSDPDTGCVAGDNVWLIEQTMACAERWRGLGGQPQSRTYPQYNRSTAGLEVVNAAMGLPNGGVLVATDHYVIHILSRDMAAVDVQIPTRAAGGVQVRRRGSGFSLANVPIGPSHDEAYYPVGTFFLTLQSSSAWGSVLLPSGRDRMVVLNPRCQFRLQLFAPPGTKFAFGAVTSPQRLLIGVAEKPGIVLLQLTVGGQRSREAVKRIGTVPQDVASPDDVLCGTRLVLVAKARGKGRAAQTVATSIDMLRGVVRRKLLAGRLVGGCVESGRPILVTLTGGRPRVTSF